MARRSRTVAQPTLAVRSKVVKKESQQGTYKDAHEISYGLLSDARDRQDREAEQETRKARDRVAFMPWNENIRTSTDRPLDFKMFPFQREWYESDDIVYARTVIVMKSTQCGACLDPDTPVLTADLAWKRIDDLAEGDEIVCVDEELPGGSGRQRRMRLGRVEAKWDVYEDAVRLTMTDGSVLVATPDHRFLCSAYKGSQYGQTRWRKVKKLRPGDLIRRLVEAPWAEPTYEDGWMGGLLDGEGTLRNRPAVGGTEASVAQQLNDTGVYERARSYLRDRGYTFSEEVSPRPNGKGVGRVRLTRRHEILRLTGSTQPSRWRRWWVGQGIRSHGKDMAWGEIAAIESLGQRRMIDLQTSHKTYIANGYISHNSEYFVRWSLFFPDMHGDRALYIFPASRQLKDFSDERIRPLVRSEYLSTRVPRDSVDNKMLKDVGRGKWYARGSTNATDLDAGPASVLCLDEYDDLVQAHIPRAEKRLSAPTSRGLIRRFGVPRYSDLGIHGEWNLSDQRRWHVTCGKCKAELPVHFYRQEHEPHHFVDTERAAIVCGKCETPIKPEWIIGGRWIAAFPERKVIGYHVSRLILPTAPIDEIIAESKRKKPWEVQEFWNATLGLPFDPEEGRLSKRAIAAATRDYYIGDWDSGYSGPHLVTAGVDVASSRAINVRVSEHLDEYSKRALFVGTVEDFDQVAVIVEAYKVQCMLIDHLPEGRLARAVANRYPGRVYTVSWGDQQGELLKVDDETRAVHARRTETISATLDMIRQQKNELPQNVPEEYVSHMRAAVQKREEDEKGRVRVFYETRTDHDYLQAESYDLLATEVWWINYGKGEIERATLERLEDVVPFERSHLGEIGYVGTTRPQKQKPQPALPPQAEEVGDPGEQDLEFDRYRDWEV